MPGPDEIISDIEAKIAASAWTSLPPEFALQARPRVCAALGLFDDQVYLQLGGQRVATVQDFFNVFV
ncbi:hypothetical protein CASFOL_009043 [Castilleja foliolosa]|uniref:Uncharacterized protein n=1 Tax=Castilleja foliolosa TaxID=1961234 RepID=A0ABD3E0P2_9LAMI